MNTEKAAHITLFLPNEYLVNVSYYLWPFYLSRHRDIGIFLMTIIMQFSESTVKFAIEKTKLKAKKKSQIKPKHVSHDFSNPERWQDMTLHLLQWNDNEFIHACTGNSRTSFWNNCWALTFYTQPLSQLCLCPVGCPYIASSSCSSILISNSLQHPIPRSVLIYCLLLSMSMQTQKITENPQTF